MAVSLLQIHRSIMSLKIRPGPHISLECLADLLSWIVGSHLVEMNGTE